jgi:hypothetical protein
MKDHGIVGEASPVSEVKIERFTRPAKLKGWSTRHFVRTCQKVELIGFSSILWLVLSNSKTTLIYSKLKF